MTERKRPTLDELREKVKWVGAYAAQPGTGPADETCATCAHLRGRHCGKGGKGAVSRYAAACGYWEQGR